MTVTPQDMFISMGPCDDALDWAMGFFEYGRHGSRWRLPLYRSDLALLLRACPRIEWLAWVAVMSGFNCEPLFLRVLQWMRKVRWFESEVGVLLDVQHYPWLECEGGLSTPPKMIVTAAHKHYRLHVRAAANLLSDAIDSLFSYCPCAKTDCSGSNDPDCSPQHRELIALLESNLPTQDVLLDLIWERFVEGGER